MNFQTKNEELSNHRPRLTFKSPIKFCRGPLALHTGRRLRNPSGCRENFCFRAKADVTPSEQPRSRAHLAARGPSRRRRSRHPAARKGAGDESRARRPPRASDACDRARDRRARIARARFSDPDSSTMGDSSREARCEAWEDEQRRLDESWVSTPCPCVDDAKAPGQVRERPDSPSDTHPNVSRKLACPPNEQPRLNH